MSELNQTEGKEITEVTDEALAALIDANSKLASVESEGEGVKADYLLLAKSGTKALSKLNKDLYIQGLVQGDIFIQKDKIILGAEVKVVPLAFITLYQERENASQDAKFFGVWNKEQAAHFELCDGSYYNRQLPNGHILVPVNWVMVTVIGHHEIENAVITFKSTGARIWKKWKEDAKTRSSASATLVYILKEGMYNNDKYSWTDFDFSYAESLLETDRAEAVFCLKKSNSLREAYEKHLLIADHVVVEEKRAALPSANVEDDSLVEDSYDEDNEF